MELGLASSVPTATPACPGSACRVGSMDAQVSALVDSVRGPGGGYRLAQDMTQISVADIILAVDEVLDSTQCGGRENCRDENKCITHNLWANLNQHIFGYLGAVTLKQLVDEQKAGQNGVAQVHDMRKTVQKRERAAIAV